MLCPDERMSLEGECLRTYTYSKRDYVRQHFMTEYSDFYVQSKTHLYTLADHRVQDLDILGPRTTILVNLSCLLPLALLSLRLHVPI